MSNYNSKPHLQLLDPPTDEDLQSQTLFDTLIEWIINDQMAYKCTRCRRLIEPSTKHARITAWRSSEPEFRETLRIHAGCYLAQTFVLSPGETVEHQVPREAPATGPPVAVLNIRKEHKAEEMRIYYHIAEVLEWTVDMIAGEPRSEWPRHVLGLLGLLEIESLRNEQEFDDLLTQIHTLIGLRLEEGDWPHPDRAKET